MPAQRIDQDTPHVGQMVLYRNSRYVDVPAVITALAEPEWDPDPDNPGGLHQVFRYVHLHQFPPPGEANEHIDRQWGAPRHESDGEPLRGTWRPLPERK